MPTDSYEWLRIVIDIVVGLLAGGLGGLVGGGLGGYVSGYFSPLARMTDRPSLFAWAAVHNGGDYGAIVGFFAGGLSAGLGDRIPLVLLWLGCGVVAGILMPHPGEGEGWFGGAVGGAVLGSMSGSATALLHPAIWIPGGIVMYLAMRCLSATAYRRLDDLREGPGASAEASNTAEAPALGELLKTYYQRPWPQQIESFVRRLDQSEILSLDTSEAPVVGFFAEVFHRHPDRREGWREVVNEQSEKTRKVLQRALEFSEDPKTSISETESSTVRNDMLWGAFFAGGDAFYIRTLVDELRYFDAADDDPNLLEVARTAKWSLSVNARDHEAVRSILDGMIAEGGSPLLDEVKDLLRRDPEEILGAYTLSVP